MATSERLVTVCTARQMEAQIIKGREVKIMVPEHLVKETKGILGTKT